VDVGTVSSEDVLSSYERQLSEAHRRIAMLEAALERESRAAAQARALARQNEGQEEQE
jgi:nicotinic acid mononucleotide adenylyltransferase